MARQSGRPRNPEASPKELSAALALFNKGVETSRDLDRRQKAIDKADRRRKDAASKMKAVLDREPSAEERSAAEAEYREAVDAWQALVSPSDEAPEESVEDGSGDESAEEASG